MVSTRLVRDNLSRVGCRSGTRTPMTSSRGKHPTIRWIGNVICALDRVLVWTRFLQNLFRLSILYFAYAHKLSGNLLEKSPRLFKPQWLPPEGILLTGAVHFSHSYAQSLAKASHAFSPTIRDFLQKLFRLYDIFTKYRQPPLTIPRIVKAAMFSIKKPRYWRGFYNTISLKGSLPSFWFFETINTLQIPRLTWREWEWSYRATAGTTRPISFYAWTVATLWCRTRTRASSLLWVTITTE